MAFVQPFGFKDKFDYSGHSIQYIELSEIGQGGPEVGSLYIDGVNNFNKFFSVPLIYYNQYMFIPVLQRSLFGSGFKIGIIDLNNLSLKVWGKKENLILFDKVINDVIYYYTDINNTTRKELKI